MTKYKGFTLIEILVALLILAIIGGMMVVGLRSAMRSQSVINHRSSNLSELQSAIIVMERDMAQIINRPIIDVDGSTQPAIIAKYAGAKLNLEFTHAGYINPFATANRSTLQRVSYSWDGSSILRTTWSELDRTPGTTSDTQTILSNVKGFSARFLDISGQFYEAGAAAPSQPTVTKFKQFGQQNLNAPLPLAVEFTIDVGTFGSVTRLIALPGKL